MPEFHSMSKLSFALSLHMGPIEDLRAFIVAEAFHGQPPGDFADDYDLIESGVMDSLLMMNLITYVSRQYSVELGVNDLVPKNFNSVSAFSQFLETKLPSAQVDSTTLEA
jgi:acyl carrier protein